MDGQSVRDEEDEEMGLQGSHYYSQEHDDVDDARNASTTPTP